MAEDPELDPTASGCASGRPRLSWIPVPPCASSVFRSRRADNAEDRSVRRSNVIAARVRLAAE